MNMRFFLSKRCVQEVEKHKTYFKETKPTIISKLHSTPIYLPNFIKLPNCKLVSVTQIHTMKS